MVQPGVKYYEAVNICYCLRDTLGSPSDCTTNPHLSAASLILKAHLAFRYCISEVSIPLIRRLSGTMSCLLVNTNKKRLGIMWEHVLQCGSMLEGM